MKVKQPILCAALASLTLSQAVATVIDFNGSTDLEDLFNNSQSYTPGVEYTHNASSGTAASGAIDITTDSTANVRPVFTYDSLVLNTEAFNFANIDGTAKTYTVKIDFKLANPSYTAAESQLNLLRIGFKTKSTGGFLTPDTILSLRTTTTENQFHLFMKQGGGVQKQFGNFTLPDEDAGTPGNQFDNWLRLEVTMSDSATEDALTATATIYDIGATGTDTPVVIDTRTHSDKVNTTLGDTAVFGGFRIDTEGLDQVAAVDNFELIGLETISGLDDIATEIKIAPTVSWDTIPGITYYVESTTDIGSVPFTEESGSETEGDGNSTTWVDLSTEGLTSPSSKFYRVGTR